MTAPLWRQPAAAAVTASTAVLLTAAVTTPFRGVQWDSLVTALALTHASVLMVLAVRRLPRSERRPWAYALLAVAAATLQLLSTNLPAQDLFSVANAVLFVPSGGGAIACCWALSRAAGRAGVTPSVFGADSVYVVASVFTLAYALLVEPLQTTRAVTGTETATLVGYCVYAAMSIGYAAVVVTRVSPRLRAAATVLLGAMVFTAVSASAFVLMELLDPRVWMTVSNLALLVAGYLVVVAVRMAGRPDRTTPRDDDGAGTALRVLQVALLAPAVALLSTLLRGTPISTTLVVLLFLLFLCSALGIGAFVYRMAGLDRQLTRTQQDLLSLIDGSSDPIVVLDRELRVVACSPVVAGVLRLGDGPVLGTRLPDLFVAEDRDLLRAALQPGGLRGQGGTQGAGPELVRLDGGRDGVRDLEVVCSGTVEDQLVVRIDDVTDRREQLRSLARMAYTDHLTGLPNRAAFEDAGAAWAAEHADAPAGVLVVDLDGFKAVNDTAGHEAGDLLLVEVGRRLRRVVRDEDVVARLGGDEFALLVRGLPDEVDDVARRLLTSVSLPYATVGGDFPVGASIGVSSLGPAGAQAAVREADEALRSAKELGKGCVRRHTPAVVEQSRRTTVLSRDLVPALRAGRLRVGYRPVTAPGTGRVTALELTPTWDHPALGPVADDVVRALAHRHGVTAEVQRWLVGQALEEAGPLLRGLDVALAASVAADERLPQGRAAHWLARIDGAGLRTDQIVLLVSEEVLATAGEDVVAVVSALQAAGVRLCVADHGLGRTLVAQQAQLPFDAVRVDLGGLGRVDADHVARAVRSCAAAAGAYGTDVVLAGVTTAEQYALACDLDVAGVTGQFVHQAVPVAALPALLGIDGPGAAAADPSGPAELAGSAS
ncbi:diguanylate cyclase domain-containing protein [Goekera deserti]|uniref:Diguanylate cyclase n=1 Tax=Goekera deserti TaxID=2497753 RepID=A0A7K3WH90_9ACTN|nr:diguanylate cyclase [Goekera deserti]NDI48531.1 diguanylate cyclase [Goekera deserti]NEL55090.1 diguanylate cyclase [Goekera deserti]